MANGYKTHFAILKANGQFDRLACGQEIEGRNGCVNDFTTDAANVTCVRCEARRTPVATVAKVEAKPKFWSKWIGGGRWEAATKSSVLHYAGAEVVARLTAGEVVESGNFTYAYGTQSPA